MTRLIPARLKLEQFLRIHAKRLPLRREAHQLQELSLGHVGNLRAWWSAAKRPFATGSNWPTCVPEAGDPAG